VAGRFSKHHKRCIGEEDNESNNSLIDTDVSIIVILVNAIIFSVIDILREDPLSPGILDMFFQKYPYHVSILVSEFTYLEIAQFFNSFNSNDPSRGRQFDSILSTVFDPVFPQY
jgi:hypothetical protein